MNSQIKAILLSSLLISCTISTASAEDPNIQYPNGVAAIVDTRVITMEDLHRKLGPFIRQLQRECTTQTQFQEKLMPLAQEVLDRMINDILLVNSFMADKKLRIPESYLENHYTKFLVEHFQGNRSNYLDFLAAEGKTDREIREQQKEEVIIGFLRSRMTQSKATISPTKIQKYYEENLSNFTQKEEIHLRQIVLINEPDDLPEPIDPIQETKLLVQENVDSSNNIPKTELSSENPIEIVSTEISNKDSHTISNPPGGKKVQNVLSLLKKGETFTEVAKQFSEDGMQKSGGDLGWISRSDIRKELADVAFSLNKNQFSDPITFNNLTFILYIEDRKNAGIIPLEKISDDIEKTLSDNYTKQSEAQYVQKLRKKAHIRYYL